MRSVFIFSMVSMCSMLYLGGCGEDSLDGPPQVRLGDSVCAECGMIVSDERFATATIVEGDRGPSPLIFDDFNCQINFETKHADIVILTRWSHDHQSSAWFKTGEGWFVKSSQLHTPMASNMAAFTHKSDAQTLADTVEGEVLGFESIWLKD